MKMTFVDFSRDMFFYALAIALFVWFFIDGHVTMQESWWVPNPRGFKHAQLHAHWPISCGDVVHVCFAGFCEFDDVRHRCICLSYF